MKEIMALLAIAIITRADHAPNKCLSGHCNTSLSGLKNEG